MQDDEIQIELVGSHGSIDPRAVADAISAADKILRNVAGDVPPVLAVSDLSVGSAKFAIRCDLQRVDEVREGIRTLASSPEVPSNWSTDSVNGLIELQRVGSRRGVESIKLRIDNTVTIIDEELAEHAKASIAAPPRSLGSARGRLYRYNNSGDKRTAGLRDYRNGCLIEVAFPEHLTADVRSALDHEVEVWGYVRRDVNDRIHSITITGIEVFDSSRAKVALDDVAGILGPDWTDGLDSTEWVRRQRG